MFKFSRKNRPQDYALKSSYELDRPHLIELRDIRKSFRVGANEFWALKGIDLQIGAGEFVGVIGKSGSGKSTLINMVARIDTPTSGEIYVGDTALHTLKERNVALWRGKTIGIVYQFFQLIPTLTVLENVMLPMDFCNLWTRRERKQRAMDLLSLVDVQTHANKLPSTLSGGQQQRVAIARSLANDPPLLIADEPTGNLDSKTSDQVFALFEDLVAQGKTIVMVTHDDDQARRVHRTVIISDGYIVDEYIAHTLPTLDHRLLLDISEHAETQTYEPGAIMVRQGEIAEDFYIIMEGVADVTLTNRSGQAVTVDTIGQGQFFGEIAILDEGPRTATVRAGSDEPVQVLSIARQDFLDMLDKFEPFREQVMQTAEKRREDLEKK